MKPRTVLVLALVVAALAAFLWWMERGRPDASPADGEGLVVPELADGTERVAAVEIDWNGRLARLERVSPPDAADRAAGASGASGWRLVREDGSAVRADRLAVERLLGALAGLESERRIEGAEPAELGLDRPRGRISLFGADGALLARLVVGAVVPATGAMIVARQGAGDEATHAGRVHVTGASIVDELGPRAKDPAGWRDRRLFAGSRDRIERIVVRAPSDESGAPEETVELARIGDGPGSGPAAGADEERFRIVAPFEDLPDPERVTETLDLVTGLLAERFHPDEPEGGDRRAAMGLAPPRATVEVALAPGAGPGLLLELGDTLVAPEGGEPRRYARVVRAPGSPEGPTEIVEIEAVALDVLSGGAPSWRSPRWSLHQPFTVERLDVEPRRAAAFAIERGTPDWHPVDDPDVAVPFTAVSDLLLAVTSARAERVEEAPARVLARPLLRLVLEPEAEEERGETLILYPQAAEAGGLYPATSSERPGVRLLLGAATVAEIEDGAAALGAALDDGRVGAGGSGDG